MNKCTALTQPLSSLGIQKKWAQWLPAATAQMRGVPEAVQVADRFHLKLNLSQAVERELAVQRQHLRVTAARTFTRPRREENAKVANGEILIRSSVCKQQAEIVRQLRR
jgi:hypothetical protein